MSDLNTETLEWLRDNTTATMHTHQGILYEVDAVGASIVAGGLPPINPVGLHSLDAIAAFIDAYWSNLPQVLAVTVDGPSVVRVQGGIDEYQRRHTYAVAETDNDNLDESWMDPVTMRRMLATRVSPGNDREKVISLLTETRVQEAVVQNIEGLGFKVATESKLHSKEWAEVTDPVFELAPYRTFAEIDQPTSPYLLEASVRNESPVFKLTCADVGRWRITATQDIRGYLLAKLKAGENSKDVEVIA